MADTLIDWLRAQVDVDEADVAPRLRDPYAALSDDELHQRSRHPAYEYRMTEGPRKMWRYADDPPEGDGWELNTTSVDSDAWERFEYTEERYWRRLRPEGSREWTPHPNDVRKLREVEAKRQIIAMAAEAEHKADAWPAEPDDVVATRVTMEKVLRLLALPYADRPGYRKEWRP